MNRFEWNEIVRVDSPLFLVSSRHNACRYETISGRPLSPGYYLAMGPARESDSFYGSETDYFGPFTTMQEAQLLQSSFLRQGIAGLALASPGRSSQDDCAD